MIRTFIAITMLCFASLQMEAKIIETRYIEDVIPLIDEDTWFLVDLDNCLFEGSQALGHANWFYDELQKRMEAGFDRDQAIRDFYPQWIETQKICLVKPLEDNFVSALLDFQKKGVIVMALTHRQPYVSDSTLRQVESLGIDFLLSAPSSESFSIPSSTPTLYTQGILFVGDYNKKIDIFEPFLNMINMKPKKIVFIDDKRKNVEELEILYNSGIEYTGVHYRAIEYATRVYDREIAEFQYKFFKQIMSNEAALLLMQQDLGIKSEKN